MTSIEWTDRTWNPIVGCSRVSRGCEHCYAERVAHRGMSRHHKGLTVLGKHGPRWTGEVRVVEERLDLPRHWRRPSRVFVNSLSDLFHETLPIPAIARVFATMAACPRHTFQVLTKRASRMREVLASDLFWHDVERAWLGLLDLNEGDGDIVANVCAAKALPGVWLGVSVEDQATADERIPQLLRVRAARRFVSYEPALGPLDLRGWGDAAPVAPDDSAPETWAGFNWPEWIPTHERQLIASFWSESWGRGPRAWLRDHVIQGVPTSGTSVLAALRDDGWATVDKMSTDGVRGRYLHMWNNIGRIVTETGDVVCCSAGRPGWLSKWLQRDGSYASKLHWVIVGGESGPGARHCDTKWARSVVAQCRAAGVAVFVKQLGAAPRWSDYPPPPQWTSRAPDRKGGNPMEWPEDLRVREFPVPEVA